MAAANPEDVREVISTDLSDVELVEIIDRVERTVRLTYPDGEFASLQHQADFVASVSALWIAGNKDRRAQSISSESASVTYETSVIDQLRAQVARLDPGEAFSFSGGARRDTDRFISSANNT